ncbi:tetratricopeptide repeat protein [Halorhodospira neutriphila]|uniref:Tetratricopeptide repeat protein n=1 Tax=Halorhodospira neutriphila TaxID=168379 RepID=A0ABS1E3E9_9GAMM|nr:tetratricopeptide repeat protein [Halorhodospira neutriphila]MBK1725747.1 hypothetical protein [Halorhodospira neutriphila]
METLEPATLVTILSVVVALFGVIVLAITVYEYTQLRALRDDFEQFKAQWRSELQDLQKALQRVIASYGSPDPETRIGLLKDAVEIYPQVFNGYNALGYAYLSKGELAQAADAFHEAIRLHPDQVEGYCDLARAYYRQNEQALAEKYLRKALDKDREGTRGGLRGDGELEHLLESLARR